MIDSKTEIRYQVSGMTIADRKNDHLRIALEREVRFRAKKTGFEAFDFIHCALPEMDLDDVDTCIEFLGKTLSFPLMVSAMTGGCPEAEKINAVLAESCQEEGVALGVGSQRAALDDKSLWPSFEICRKKAPDTILVGNIGAEEVAASKTPDAFQELVERLDADALAVHLNPLQEVLQPEGKAAFSGVLDGIGRLVDDLDVPVIVKEVGCGISESVARSLKHVGVQIVDVAGAGGTSWAGIESYRSVNKGLALRFWDWGIPTAEAVEMVCKIPDLQVIASGGITDGVVMAKALALGTELCGTALPVLRVLHERDSDGVLHLFREWKDELRLTMFLTGSRDIADLRRDDILQKRSTES